MKEKKGIIIGIIIAIVILILSILIIPIVRKTVILSTISKKIVELEESKDNVYKKVEYDGKIVESYILGDKRKDVMNGETVQVVLRKDETTHYYTFTNPVDEGTSTFLQAMKKKIKTVEVDGKKCYEITTKDDALPMNDNEIPQESVIYVEKDTGITIKRIDCVEVDSTKKEYVSTSQYEFDKVTEENFTEPLGYKNFSTLRNN